MTETAPRAEAGSTVPGVPAGRERAYAGALALLKAAGNESTFLAPHLSNDMDNGVCLFWTAGSFVVEVTVDEAGVPDWGRFRTGETVTEVTDPARITAALRSVLPPMTEHVRAAWSAQDAGNPTAAILLHGNLAAAAAEPPLVSDEVALALAVEATDAVEATLVVADDDEGFAWHDSGMHE